MIRLLSIFLATSAVFLSARYSDAGNMDGEWVSVTRIRAGAQQLGVATNAQIRDGKFSTIQNGKISEAGKMTEVTDGAIPGYSLIMSEEVASVGKSFNGIYSVSGDTMFTCVSPVPDAKRPTAFTSTKENGHILIVWMRKAAVAKLAPATVAASKDEPIRMDVEGRLESSADGGVLLTFDPQPKLLKKLAGSVLISFDANKELAVRSKRLVGKSVIVTGKLIETTPSRGYPNDWNLILRIDASDIVEVSKASRP